jgi:hypothetical protein
MTKHNKTRKLAHNKVRIPHLMHLQQLKAEDAREKVAILIGNGGVIVVAKRNQREDEGLVANERQLEDAKLFL